MFLHPTVDYDFLLHLDPAVVPRYPESLFANASIWGGGKKFVNLNAMDIDGAGMGEVRSVYGNEIRIDFDPVRMLVRELQVSKIIDSSPLYHRFTLLSVSRCSTFTFINIF